MLLADYYLAAWLFQKNRVDTALKAIDAVITRAEKTVGYNETAVKFWLLRGNILNRTGGYNETLKQNFSLLNLAEQHHDTTGLVRFSTSIGNVNARLKKDKEAMDWHYRALGFMQTDKQKAAYSLVYINIAVVYYHMAVQNDTPANEDSISVNLQRAITWSRRGNNLTILANSLSMYGKVLAEYQKTKAAEAALTEALEIRKKIGDVYYEILDMIALASIYDNNNDYKKAIATCLQALELTNANGRDFSSMITVYSSLGNIYSKAGDYQKHNEILKEQMQLQDSLYKSNSAETMVEMETKYEVQKKENTIIRQNYDLAKKNYLVGGALLLLLLGAVFSFILIRQNRKKQELKLRMIQEEEHRMSAIAVATAQEKERRRIAAELHDNLGGQLSYISSNMDFILDAPVELSVEEKNRRLGKVNEVAKTTISDLRETIWALKKETVEIEELADKLKAYAHQQLANRPDMILDVQEQITDRITLSPVAALNIFRVFQEAVNNAIRHSGADRMSLTITTSTKPGYCITLADNGKGFDINAVYDNHYGVENMKERAKELHANLVIQSGESGGTIVKLSTE